MCSANPCKNGSTRRSIDPGWDRSIHCMRIDWLLARSIGICPAQMSRNCISRSIDPLLGSIDLPLIRPFSFSLLPVLKTSS
ncbi:hypothetical protein N665_0234s0032 [Sinapis alba]|nr:hypothetical protein N665_0234s0032 [Sinapis alba]